MKRRRTWFVGSVLLVLLCADMASAQRRRPRRNALPSARSTPAQLGINLAGPVDWNTEQPCVNLFRLSRAWISQRDGADWGKGPQLELDEHGWIKRLESGCRADTMMCTINGGHFPSGRYTVLYDGEGTIEFSRSAEVVASRPGRLMVQVDASRGGIRLRLATTNPRNYVRNIRVYAPGMEQAAEKSAWHTDFLKRWQGFACLRFMDFMHTNNSPQRTWEQRPKVEDATWTPHGFPVEVMCDLANQLRADAWFCLPHAADDDYIQRFAETVKQHLQPERRVYVEYSNEVWNRTFEQHRYAVEQGQQLGLSQRPLEAAWRYTAHRSVEIFEIWERVFEGRDRLVKVLATQSANPWVTRQILEHNHAARQADVLAIAPYFGLNLGPDEAAAVLRGGVQGVLDRLEQERLPEVFEDMNAQKQLADRHRLQLVCYEAGQHLVGRGAARNNEQLTELLTAANRHPRMGRLYQTYLDGWNAGGGQLMCLFSSVSGWSRYGSWGLLEFADDDPARSPKYSAVVKWAKAHGQDVLTP